MENNYHGWRVNLMVCWMSNPLQNVKVSPRVANALRLYAMGIAPTKKAASEAAGLHPNYLTMLTRPNGGSDPAKDMLAEIEEMMMDKTVDMNVVVQRLGRLGIGKIAQLALAGSNDRIQLDAAKSLADRSPETAGIQKVQVDPFTLGSTDAKALAEALVESARMRSTFAHVARDGLVEVQLSEAEDAMRRLPETTGGAEEGGNNGSGSGEATGPGSEGQLQGPQLVTD